MKTSNTICAYIDGANGAPIVYLEDVKHKLWLTVK